MRHLSLCSPEPLNFLLDSVLFGLLLSVRSGRPNLTHAIASRPEHIPVNASFYPKPALCYCSIKVTELEALWVLNSIAVNQVECANS